MNPFNQPFRSKETNRHKLISILVFGLFIFLFLFLFGPFGLSQIEPLNRLLLSLGFGVVTTFALSMFKFMIEPIVIGKSWNLGKNILWDFLIALSIGVSNFFYVSLIFPGITVFKYLLPSVWTAFLVGSIPVSINYIILFNRRNKPAPGETEITPGKVSRGDEIIIHEGNQKSELRLNAGNIVYLCSNDNYVTIVQNNGDTLSKTHIRWTLKEAESLLSRNSSFMRCHKCFIVNSEYISHLTGNVQNMKIKLTFPGVEIPVARSKASGFSRKFRS